MQDSLAILRLLGWRADVKVPEQPGISAGPALDWERLGARGLRTVYLDSFLIKTSLRQSALVLVNDCFCGSSG